MTIVVFDLDDTLYEEKGPKVAAECRVAAGLSEHLGLSHADALRAFITAKRMVSRQRELGPARNERPRWIEETMTQHGVSDARVVDELAAAYWETLLDEVRPYADALIALPVLAERFDLWVATNEHEVPQRKKLERLGLADLFAGVVSADQVGYEKPEPEFFSHLASMLGVDATDVVFVGDNPHTDVLGACRAGLRCIHFRRGAYATFDLGSLPGCEPTWTVDYLTDIEPLLRTSAP